MLLRASKLQRSEIFRYVIALLRCLVKLGYLFRHPVYNPTLSLKCFSCSYCNMFIVATYQSINNLLFSHMETLQLQCYLQYVESNTAYHRAVQSMQHIHEAYITYFSAVNVILSSSCASTLCILCAHCLAFHPTVKKSIFWKPSSVANFLLVSVHIKVVCILLGCCQAYNISTYPEYETLNSQVNEQQNSTLKKLRSQLSYMGQDSFMAHCKLFFWYRNRLAAKKMSQAPSQANWRVTNKGCRDILIMPFNIAYIANLYEWMIQYIMHACQIYQSL